MGAFKIEALKDGKIALQFLHNEPQSSGENVPVLECQHLFRADTFKKMIDRGAAVLQQMQDIVDADKQGREIEDLDEEDLEC